MMLQMMQKQAGGGQEGAQPTAPNVPANPQTKEEITAFLDNLDMKLANGQISEQTYQMLHDKWQKRLESM
jgi:hypothetical protein